MFTITISYEAITFVAHVCLVVSLIMLGYYVRESIEESKNRKKNEEN